MIKKYFLTVILIIMLFFSYTTSIIHAEDQIVTGEPTPKVDDSIKNLKDKIEKKVEELTKNNKKILAGYIIKNEKDIMELKNFDHSQSAIIKVIIDESVTQFYSFLSGTKKTAQVDEFVKNDFVIVSGPFIDNTINANSIYKIQEYEVKSGKITDVDKKEFTITVLTTEKDVYTLDIEQYTKRQQMDPQNLFINTIGFSKLTQGDTIHFTIKKTENKKNMRASALRILIIPQAYFKQNVNLNTQ